MTEVLVASHDRHGWIHSMCDRCWNIKRGGTFPCRVRYPETDTCCWCGRDNNSGIYLRYRPDGDDIPWCPDRTETPRSIFFSKL